jgi:hypothetical protein
MVAIVAVLLGGSALSAELFNVLVGVHLAAAATAHVSRDAAARFLVTSFNSGFEHVFSSVYFVGIFAAPVLVGVGCFGRLLRDRHDDLGGGGLGSGMGYFSFAWYGNR